MPLISDRDPTKPFGKLKLSEEETKFSKRGPCDRVFVYWDVSKHCPLPPACRIRYLLAYINQSLGKLDEKLFVEHVTFVGDSDSVTDIQIKEIHNNFQMTWKEACDRDPVCDSCKKPDSEYEGKKAESADAVMVRELMGHAYDYPAPGYVMVISADSNFSRAMRFMGKRGFKVLLAHHLKSRPNFHTYADFSWLFPGIIDGEGPKYDRNGRLPDDFSPISLGFQIPIPRAEREFGLINPDPSERNSEIPGFWDVENTPLPQGYLIEELIPKINLALSKFNNGHNRLKLSRLNVVGSDAVHVLSESRRQTLVSSGPQFGCQVHVETPDRRKRICSSCQTPYNSPSQQTYQDDFSRVIDVADFLLTEKLMEYLVNFRTPGFVLLISGDKDFGPTLAFLRKRGFKIILAQPSIKKATTTELHSEAHLGWKFEDLLEGKEPVWFTEVFPKYDW
ncbi:unnamed protein product [Microthlaspi erraticum]|uniref:NYN domain-containing protein n=1 Tax=Microthlaspi erraticum TaxID=1685480 RepID=A0A6D2HGR0_9BRAS|nr:unnamed protein product [Microthlaspi erraticum]